MVTIQHKSWVMCFFLMIVNTALAGSPCYQVHDFPSASKFEITSYDNLVVYLNNRDRKLGDPNGVIYENFKSEGWKKIDAVEISSLQGETLEYYTKNRASRCRSLLGQIADNVKPSKEELAKLYPRSTKYIYGPEFRYDHFASSCFEASEYTYVGLGIGQADGGGMSIGGIARISKQSGKVEVARSEDWLNETSINSIIEFNNQTFIGTTGFFECSGIPPTNGFLLYNWETDQISSFKGDEICGAVIHDMAVWDGYIWLATDMGISRGKAPPIGKDPKLITNYIWENYALDGAEIKQTTCKDLYYKLLLEMPTPRENYVLQWESIYFLTENISQKNYVLNEFYREFFEKHFKSKEYSFFQYDIRTLVKGIESIKSKIE